MHLWFSSISTLHVFTLKEARQKILSCTQVFTIKDCFVTSDNNEGANCVVAFQFCNYRALRMIKCLALKGGLKLKIINHTTYSQPHNKVVEWHLCPCGFCVHVHN